MQANKATKTKGLQNVRQYEKTKSLLRRKNCYGRMLVKCLAGKQLSPGIFITQQKKNVSLGNKMFVISVNTQLHLDPIKVLIHF